MAFLKDSDFEDLPENDYDAFVKLEAISRARLLDTERDRDGDLNDDNIMGYMNEIMALANQFNISDIFYDNNVKPFYAEYAAFIRRVEYQTVQIKVQRIRRDQRNSVAISGPGRERIQHHIERLRSEVEKSTLPERRKRALLEKIASFEAELAKTRFNDEDCSFNL